jgi:hypothetical protein
VIWVLLYVVFVVGGFWLLWKGYYAFLGAAKRSLNEAADSRTRAQGMAVADALRSEETEKARIERLNAEISHGEAMAAAFRATAETHAALVPQLSRSGPATQCVAPLRP